MSTAQNPAKPERSAAELELKRRGRRRLIGAVTMGLLAIVVLPMIFDAEPKRKDTARQEIEIQIPPKEGLPPLATPVAPPVTVSDATPKEAPKAEPNVTPPQTPAVSAKTAPAGDTPSKPGSAKPEQAEQKAPTKADPKTAVKTEVRPEKKIEAKTGDAPPTKAVAGGFVIQIGAYKDADNAKSVVARMKEAKLPVFTDTVAVKTGNVTRVRVGPYVTKDKAESALAEVKLAGVDGKVVPQ